MFLHQLKYFIFPFLWIYWFLNRLYSNDQNVWSFRISGVLLYKLFPCPDKPETLKLSLSICISERFSILVLLLEQFDLGIDLDLSTVFFCQFFKYTLIYIMP